MKETLTVKQQELFEELHRSRLEELRTFSKKDYHGVWYSVIEKYPELSYFCV